MEETSKISPKEVNNICKGKNKKQKLLLLTAGYNSDYINHYHYNSTSTKDIRNILFGEKYMEIQKEYYKKLNKIEKQIIYDMTVRYGSKYINDYLRDRNNIPNTIYGFEEVKKRVKKEKGMSKKEYNETIINIVINILDYIMSNAPRTNEEVLMFRGIETLPKGKRYTNEGYLFVSRDPYQITNFITDVDEGYFLRVSIPRNMPILFLDLYTSKSVKNQKGVLIPRNTTFEFNNMAKRVNTSNSLCYSTKELNYIDTKII